LGAPKFGAHSVDRAPIVYIINLVFHDFRWIRWNVDKVEKHGCTPLEAQQVVNNPSRGFPRRSGEKYQVHGRGNGGRWVQVAYLIDPEGTIFVIHAMPLSRRRRRGGR
jgi:hypothetical protein